MVNTIFSDEIVNATDLRTNQKRWLEAALTKPITVSYGRKQLALIDREQVSSLYKAIYYLELVIKTCEEYERERNSTVLPWTEYLSGENRVKFHNELLKATIKATLTNDWDSLECLIEDWKATAEVESNPGLSKELLAEDNPAEYVKIDQQV